MGVGDLGKILEKLNVSFEDILKGDTEKGNVQRLREFLGHYSINKNEILTPSYLSSFRSYDLKEYDFLLVHMICNKHNTLNDEELKVIYDNFADSRRRELAQRIVELLKEDNPPPY
ncbi:MAG: hypothetical protein KKG60_01050 [Nanoarchaeota archaeon]|nr:hypothetical protein [Nanoarchaeota archaeon]